MKNELPKKRRRKLGGLRLAKWHNLPWKRSKYRGRAILQTPVDLWLFTELIERLRPGLFVEVGVNEGGFTAWLLDTISAVDSRTVVLGVDRDFGRFQGIGILSRNLRLVEADALADSVVAEIELRRTTRPTIFLLDDDHSPEHVERELDQFGGLSRPGDWLIVGDSTTVVGLDQVAENFVGSGGGFRIVPERFGLSNHTWIEHAGEVMAELIRPGSAFFVCRDCVSEGGTIRRVRAMEPGKRPTLPCSDCGGSGWFELLDLDRRTVVENLGPRAIARLRLFFCWRCGDGSIQTLAAGEKLRPCHCGSRVFRELVGDARLLYLRTLRGEL